MNIQLLLVPYDSGHRGWRCGAGPEHLLRAGLPGHLERLGHVVTAIQVLEDDPAQYPAEIPHRAPTAQAARANSISAGPRHVSIPASRRRTRAS
jgi:hypothetical protein